jgi:hypothetical protein
MLRSLLSPCIVFFQAFVEFFQACIIFVQACAVFFQACVVFFNVDPRIYFKTDLTTFFFINLENFCIYYIAVVSPPIIIEEIYSGVYPPCLDL